MIRMKKYLALLLIPAAFVYSCKKTSDVPVTPASIVGTWGITADTAQEFDSGGLVSSTANIYNKGEILHFSADGTGFTVIDTIPGSTPFTYTLTGGNAVLDYPAQNYKGDQIDTARIAVLTPTSLELIYKSYYFTMAASTYHYETDVYFTRQTPLL